MHQVESKCAGKALCPVLRSFLRAVSTCRLVQVKLKLSFLLLSVSPTPGAEDYPDTWDSFRASNMPLGFWAFRAKKSQPESLTARGDATKMRRTSSCVIAGCCMTWKPACRSCSAVCNFLTAFAARPCYQLRVSGDCDVTLPYWNPYREPGNALGKQLSERNRVVLATCKGLSSFELFSCAETRKSGMPADSVHCGAWRRSTATLLVMHMH